MVGTVEQTGRRGFQMTRDHGRDHGKDDVEAVAKEVDALVHAINLTMAEMAILMEKYRALKEPND